MIHIEVYHHAEFGDEEDSRSIAECGVSAILHPNGDIEPPDYDFYQRGGAYQADCVPCLQALLKRLLDS